MFCKWAVLSLNYIITYIKGALAFDYDTYTYINAYYTYVYEIYLHTCTKTCVEHKYACKHSGHIHTNHTCEVSCR